MMGYRSLTSILRARGDGFVSWIHSGLGSHVRVGDPLMTLQYRVHDTTTYETMSLVSPFQAEVGWLLSWTGAPRALRRVSADEPLLALTRTNEDVDSVSPISYVCRRRDVALRAMSRVSPRNVTRALRCVDEIIEVAQDLRAGSASLLDLAHVTPEELDAITCAQRGEDDYTLFQAIATAFARNEQCTILRMTRNMDRILSL